MKLDDQGKADMVQAAIGGHLAVVKTDIAQVQELLRDAVTNLLSDTLAIRGACMMQQQTALGGDSGRQEKLLVLSRMIDARTNDSIVHLQFQDMVTQLLDHVLLSLTTLESCCPGEFGGSQHEYEDIAASAMPNMRFEPENGADHNLDLGSFAQVVQRKPVMSRDMRAGDVELF